MMGTTRLESMFFEEDLMLFVLPLFLLSVVIRRLTVNQGEMRVEVCRLRFERGTRAFVVVDGNQGTFMMRR